MKKNTMLLLAIAGTFLSTGAESASTRYAPYQPYRHGSMPGYASIPGRASMPGYASIPGRASMPGYASIPAHAMYKHRPL